MKRGVASRLSRAFRGDLWTHRWALVLSTVLEIVAAGAAILTPWPLKLLIDSAIAHKPLPPLLRALDPGLSPEALVLPLAAGYVLITAIGAAAIAWQKIIDARVGEQVNLELRDRVLMHLQTLPPTIRGTHRSGELVLRLVDDVKVFVRLQMRTAPLIFRYATTATLTLAVMFWIEPRLGLVGLVIIPALIAVALWNGRQLHEASREKRHHEGEVAGLAQEIVRGLPTVQVLGAEEHARERFGATNARSLEAGMQETRLEVGMERSLNIAKGFAVAVVIGGGALLVLRGNLTVGVLTVFASYISNLLKPVEKINDLASAVSKGLAAGERLLALLEHAPEVRDVPAAVHIGRARGALELEDVHFAYPGSDGRGAAVLRGATLRLEPGSFTVLLGRSGAGKSTIVSLLLRLFDPSAGTVRLDGRPITEISLRSLRAQFAVMIQDTHLFAGTVREALTPPGAEVTDERLWQALARVGLDGFFRGLTAGLDTPLGEDGVDLSGGQRRRVALARAFLLDRPILVLDEPLEGVDTANEALIVEALKRIRDRRTCLVITHRPSLLDCADAVYRLEGGRIVDGMSVVRGRGSAAGAGQ